MTEHTFRLHPAASIAVRLQVDGKPAPIDGLVIVCEEDSGGFESRTTSRGELTFGGLVGGETKLEFGVFPGFMTPEPISFDVKAGEPKEIVVELTRVK